ncbi:MAG: pyridoxamine 5'-phosphate oxidase [Yoonia sp.]|nr:pyridoxamine 5'-phosphate oxidase [Yoonia sp.]MDG1866889.1 pyridoxamine 5'-phosphate oxidase [Yoonia sp.]
MTDRIGIFAGDNPFVIAKRWLKEAEATEINDPNAMSLATVDSAGMPNVRVVLLKDIEDDAFVFYTNYEGKKAQELLASGKAAFVIHWKSLHRQIRVRGVVTKEDGQIADDYYASRSLTSRLGAWASQQSRPLDARQTLMDAVDHQAKNHGDDPVRPPFWGGFRIAPIEMEFWADGEYRLHDRFRWTWDDVEKTWDIGRLFP